MLRSVMLRSVMLRSEYLRPVLPRLLQATLDEPFNNRGLTDRGVTDRSLTDRGVTDRGARPSRHDCPRLRRLRPVEPRARPVAHLDDDVADVVRDARVVRVVDELRLVAALVVV